MTAHQTAVLWLLQHSGAADNNQAVVGDLLEEYASGQSAFWLWRQTLLLLAIFATADLCRHKLLALRAIGTGLLIVLLESKVKFWITSHPGADGAAVFWVLTLASLLLAGLAIGLTHPKHPLAMSLAFAIYAVLAKAWPYTTHFHHYWTFRDPAKLLVDVGLTTLGILLIVCGGVLSSWFRAHALGRLSSL